MSEELNLIQKLAKVRAIADSVTKDKRGYNYSYAELTAILAKITAGMNKYGVSLIPGIVPGTGSVKQNVVVNTKVDKTGKVYDQTTTEMLFTADMTFTWVNDDKPDEKVIVPWFVTGSQGDPSQALGSGLTYCTRYFLTDYFQIAQLDKDIDPDAYRSKQKEAEESEAKAVRDAIITRFDGEVRSYLAEHPERSDDVKKLVSKYVKNANYMAIKTPDLAAKLLEDFSNTFLGGM